MTNFYASLLFGFTSAGLLLKLCITHDASPVCMHTIQVQVDSLCAGCGVACYSVLSCCVQNCAAAAGIILWYCCRRRRHQKQHSGKLQLPKDKTASGSSRASASLALLGRPFRRRSPTNLVASKAVDLTPAMEDPDRPSFDSFSGKGLHHGALGPSPVDMYMQQLPSEHQVRFPYFMTGTTLFP